MTFLVTGATGLLGNNLVRRLLHDGQNVRVLTRAESDPRPLAGLDVEMAQGDIRDGDSVRRACEGIEWVLHAAARVHIGRADLALQRAINVEGTRNVAVASRLAGAKLLHVSSVDAMGGGEPGKPADEESPLEKKPLCTYVITKREAERAVFDEIGQGLFATIVNPGLLLGPWDWKPSSGRMLLAVAQRFTAVAPPGGTTVTDVRDVADGILSATRHGQSGRRYILAGENLSFFKFWTRVAQVVGAAPPRMRAGPLMRIVVGRAGDLWGLVTGREPEVNSASLRMSTHWAFYSSARAEAELGYRPRPAQEAIEAAWQWFVEHGYAHQGGANFAAPRRASERAA
jgi:dihydroflavonol-4-reductase